MSGTLVERRMAPPSVPVDTSEAAARGITGDAAALRRRVLRAIQDSGTYGRTDDEIQCQLALDGNTERPRRWELVQLRMIYDSGMRRQTRSGRRAVVWTVR